MTTTATATTRNPSDTVRRLARFWHVQLPETAVCSGHVSPLEPLSAWVVKRPSVNLLLGPRGGGKSYLRALATHIDSLRRPRHQTRILGGSLAQSEQVYDALRDFDASRPGLLASITRTKATYRRGSDVSILAASSTSVRGPHVPTLCLDEVDEIDEDIRESAMGMCMERHGVSASVSLTSTWHRLDGPMGGLLERGRAGEFPTFEFCIFDVLERCPEDRSGPNLENCPACPIVKWCHADRDSHPSGLPKAKRSRGHYAIDSLIQKARIVSARVFESDYLCSGPRADGLWFRGFDRERHVTERAEFNPALPVHLALDSGVWTGAVFFQVNRAGLAPVVTVFADYLIENGTPQSCAAAVLGIASERCQGKLDHRWTDPAGGSRNPVGPAVMTLYQQSGLTLQPWPAGAGSVADGLERIEGLLNPADGTPRLFLHPRCRHLISAFGAYRRAKRQGQWMDWPEDPQHPAEDVMDALRGGMLVSVARPAFAVTKG